MRVRKETGDFSIKIKFEGDAVTFLNDLPKNLTAEDLLGYVIERTVITGTVSSKSITIISGITDETDNSGLTGKLVLSLSDDTSFLYDPKTGKLSDLNN